jgi:eukaryotic-like serine/threonine-protein kinase
MYEVMSGNKPFGSGLQAVPSILSGQTPKKPPCIAQNPQLRPLGEEIFQMILDCLRPDPLERLTADQLVERCEGLCYPVFPRMTGIFDRRLSDKNCGFIVADNGQTVFFHFASVYGTKPEVGDRVCFSAYSGSPYDRAHPVIVLQPESENPTDFYA